MPTKRTYLNVYQDGKSRIENYTPLNNFNPQGSVKALLDIIAVEMERLYSNSEYIYNSTDPTRAVGNDLDKIAFLCGESRTGSVTASDYSDTNLYFYIDKRLNWTVKQLIEQNYTTDEIDTLDSMGYIVRNSVNVLEGLRIPTGHPVSNADKTIYYSTIAEIELTGTTDAYVGIVAAGAGPDYNVSSNQLVRHGLSDIVELRKIARFIKCANRYPIQNGRYSLTDDELRYRISTSKNAFTSNEIAIRRTSTSIPGVRDILFEKGKFGNGTVNIIVDGVSPLISQGLIDILKQRLRDTSSYGDTIFVHRPEYLGVELNFNIRVDQGVSDPMSLRNQARDVIISYINNLEIGGEIIWNRIVSSVLDIDGIIDFIPNYFKYGTYDSLNKINKEQIILRFMNQRCVYNQKWYTDSGLITCCLA